MITFKQEIFNNEYDTLSIIDKINNLTNKYYESVSDIIGKFSCPFCRSSDLIKHSKYERTIIDTDNDDIIAINIQRVCCKKCGRTHAIIPVFLVPFKRKSIFTIREIIEAVENESQILTNEYKIVKTYKSWKERLLSISFPIKNIWKKFIDLLKECASNFSMCFMQGKRRKYYNNGELYEVIFSF